MRTIWSVSHGHYSDYQVDCLFERREDAEAWLALTESSRDSAYWEGRIEEFSLFEAGRLPRRWKHYHVVAYLGDDGTLVASHTDRPDGFFAYFFWKNEVDDKPGAAVSRVHSEHHNIEWIRRYNDIWDRISGSRCHFEETPHIQFSVDGTDEQAVIKSFKDRFAEWAERTGYQGAIPEIIEWRCSE